MNRDQISNARRVVIKIGSSTLTGKAGEQLDTSHVDAIADIVAKLRTGGSEVVLVSSGGYRNWLGTTWNGYSPHRSCYAASCGLRWPRASDFVLQPSTFSTQILSSQVLLTIDDFVRPEHYENAQRTLFKLLELQVVPIINENDTVGVQEIRFGDNDRLAALVAHLIGADFLILVSDIDALYDAPPTNPEAQRISTVPDVHKLEGVQIGGVGSSGVGSGGMVTKIDAAKIATSAGITMLLTSLEKLPLALTGSDEGTLFESTDEVGASSYDQIMSFFIKP